MLSPDTQILLTVNLGGLLFYAGIHVATVRGQGKEIKGVKKQVHGLQANVEAHDREIGSMWNVQHLGPREVRR